MLRIRRGDEPIECTVMALAQQRGPAREAALLYQETEQSQQAREALREQRKLQPQFDLAQRPDRRARRRIIRFRRESTEDDLI